MNDSEHRTACAEPVSPNESVNTLVQNESGMTLVEVLITSTIMMVLALAMATMITNLSKQNDAQATKGNLTQLQNAVRSEAANVASVRASMTVVDP